MHYGVVFPQTEFGNDPGAIKDYVQTAESLGYDYVLVYDHVLGAHRSALRINQVFFAHCSGEFIGALPHHC